MYGLNLEESDDDDDYSGDSGWIQWFCGLKGHELLAEVDEEYARDNFNLYGLRAHFQYYDHALEMVLSSEAPDEDDLTDSEFLDVYREATALYGVIHCRYIISPRGLQVMRDKYLKGTFGTCPRALCDRQHVLPIGLSDETRASAMKIFCPKCEQVYSPKSKFKDLDGCFFGLSFPQIFLQSYPSLVPLDPPRPFVPRVFGFKLHKQHSLITRKLDDGNQDRATSKEPKGESSCAGRGSTG
mmetsp:Transcript_54207/g.137470  ORF Transcript_54207/g.137470 Transcript_54207/m.137470 type:complete len:241 (+) Transcript_54207:61-783(+)|eukprot:CAMPEP_0183557568 /NCGR_PEP_ID=MMETSP0371-20130417/85892_1 /TAXON_ID=268820 /ORGANISM="Peridinium aciculiferum, Strain PAER-2" /LENGTH=240 /DNA_ID=CAMNT_0025764603 /DNA_START=58 /DNA_END=780 /DNA_ORIENTATION=-